MRIDTATFAPRPGLSSVRSQPAPIGETLPLDRWTPGNSSADGLMPRPGNWWPNSGNAAAGSVSFGAPAVKDPNFSGDPQVLAALHLIESQGGKEAQDLLKRIRESGAKIEFKFTDFTDQGKPYENSDWNPPAATENRKLVNSSGKVLQDVPGDYVLGLHKKFNGADPRLLAANLAHELVHVDMSQRHRKKQNSSTNWREEFQAEMFCQDVYRKVGGTAALAQAFDAKTGVTFKNGEVGPQFSQLRYYRTFDSPRPDEAYRNLQSERSRWRGKELQRMRPESEDAEANRDAQMARSPFRSWLFLPKEPKP